MSSCSDFVTLRAGLVLPVAALRFALCLESRGPNLTVDGDDLVVSPRALLTDTDREQIRQWKLHLKAIATYEAPEVQ
jgi:hypothetical protein